MARIKRKFPTAAKAPRLSLSNNSDSDDSNGDEENANDTIVSTNANDNNNIQEEEGPFDNFINNSTKDIFNEYQQKLPKNMKWSVKAPMMMKAVAKASINHVLDHLPQNDDNEDYEYEYEYNSDTPSFNVAVEKEYYDAKGEKNNDKNKALMKFENVIMMEKEQKGVDGLPSRNVFWTFKALKQMMKIRLMYNELDEAKNSYGRILDCITNLDNKGLAWNDVEKGVIGMMKRVTTLLHQKNMTIDEQLSHDNHQNLAWYVYDTSLALFHPQNGLCSNKHLWLQNTLQYGQLLYENHETVKLQKVISDLNEVQNNALTSYTSPTNLIEINALQMLLYSRMKDKKKIDYFYYKAMLIKGGTPSTGTLALIQELHESAHDTALFRFNSTTTIDAIPDEAVQIILGFLLGDQFDQIFFHDLRVNRYFQEQVQLYVKTTPLKLHLCLKGEVNKIEAMRLISYVRRHGLTIYDLHFEFNSLDYDILSELEEINLRNIRRLRVGDALSVRTPLSEHTGTAFDWGLFVNNCKELSSLYVDCSVPTIKLKQLKRLLSINKNTLEHLSLHIKGLRAFETWAEDIICPNLRTLYISNSGMPWGDCIIKCPNLETLLIKIFYTFLQRQNLVLSNVSEEGGYDDDWGYHYVNKTCSVSELRKMGMAVEASDDCNIVLKVYLNCES